MSDQSNIRADGDALARVLFQAAARQEGVTDPNLSGWWRVDTTRWAFDLVLPSRRAVRVNISIAED